MKTQWMAAWVVALMTSVPVAEVLACGDKFLVPSRGMRFELTPAARERAAILVYARAASSLPDVFARLSVDSALRKAGDRPTMIADANEFDRTLRESNWDVVLIDLVDALARDMSATKSPALLVVAARPTASDLAQAKKRHAAILKSPTRSQAFVEAFDLAIATRHADHPNAQK